MQVFQMFKDKKPLPNMVIEPDTKSNAVLDILYLYLNPIIMDRLDKTYKGFGQYTSLLYISINE